MKILLLLLASCDRARAPEASAATVPCEAASFDLAPAQAAAGAEGARRVSVDGIEWALGQSFVTEQGVVASDLVDAPLGWELRLKLTDEAAAALLESTTALTGQHMAVLVQDQPFVVARVMGPIPGPSLILQVEPANLDVARRFDHLRRAGADCSDPPG